MKFIRTDSPRANTISTSYLSPYFPAPGTGAGISEMTWDAEVPEGTRLQLKARWVLQDEDGNIRYFPWAGITDGKAGTRIPGRNYFQYHGHVGIFTTDALPCCAISRSKSPCAAPSNLKLRPFTYNSCAIKNLLSIEEIFLSGAA